MNPPSPTFGNIPEKLKERIQWVAWKPVLRDGKWTKVPINVRTGKNAKANHPSTWASFDQAVTYYQEHTRDGNGSGVGGVGYVFSEDDPFVGIDLDKCLGEDGAVSDNYSWVVDLLASYTEVSPSGTGLHIIIEAQLASGGKRKGTFEVYGAGRYFTVTGEMPRCGYREIRACQDDLECVYRRIFQDDPKAYDVQSQHLDADFDKEIIAKAYKSRAGDKIRQLMEGKIGSYPSHSEADMALCCHLAFWLARNAVRIDCVFRSSALFRKKWDEKHFADGSTYGEYTIQKAIENTKDVFIDTEKGFNVTGNVRFEPVRVDEAELKRRASEIMDAQAPCGTFDTTCLPPLLHEYIQTICKSTEAETIIVASSVLATVGAVLKKRVFIPEGTYFQRLYPNLWMLTISPSGSFKTTALNKGASISWKAEADIREKIKALSNGLTAGADMSPQDLKKRQLEVQEQIAAIETTSSVLPHRVTGEGLLQILANGCGGCIYSSEIGDWLESLDRNHNMGLKALFTDLYDVPQQYRYKTRTQGNLVVLEPFIAICAVSTLGWVQKNIKPQDVASGFFARFLLFYPPQKDQIPAALPTYHVPHQLPLENEIKSILQRFPDERAMSISREAEALFCQVHQQFSNRIFEEGERYKAILAPYLKRWSPYILKLAMLNQVFIGPDSTEIGVEAIMGAVSVIEYAVKSTTHLFKGELGESDHQRKCRVILELVARKRGQIRRQEVLTSRVLEGGHLEYDYALDSLIEQGELVCDTASGRKNAWVYSLAPQG